MYRTRTSHNSNDIKQIGAQLQRIYSTPNKSMAAVTKNKVPLSDLNSMASASS
jgi:hypothetical protein